MDSLSPAERSLRMAKVKSRDTALELRIRKIVYGMGFRYRLHVSDLPGRPDIVVRRNKVAIFVHGCFWHRHSSSKCKLARLPKSRLDFWLPKLEGNRLRDARNRRELKAMGWKVVVIWECWSPNTKRVESAITRALRLG